MLARDPVEIAEQANSFLKQRPVAAYFDEVRASWIRGWQQSMPTRGCCDSERLARIRDAVAEIIDGVAKVMQDDAEIARVDNAEKTEEAPLGTPARYRKLLAGCAVRDGGTIGLVPAGAEPIG